METTQIHDCLRKCDKQLPKIWSALHSITNKMTNDSKCNMPKNVGRLMANYMQDTFDVSTYYWIIVKQYYLGSTFPFDSPRCCVLPNAAQLALSREFAQTTSKRMGFDEHIRCTFNGINAKCIYGDRYYTVTCQCAIHSNESKAKFIGERCDRLGATATPTNLWQGDREKETTWKYIFIYWQPADWTKPIELIESHFAMRTKRIWYNYDVWLGIYVSCQKSSRFGHPRAL